MPDRQTIERMRTQVMIAEKTLIELRNEIDLAKSANIPVPDQEKQLQEMERQIFLIKTVYKL